MASGGVRLNPADREYGLALLGWVPGVRIVFRGWFELFLFS